MAEFTDVFPFRVEALDVPFDLLEGDGEVSALQFVETLPAGMYLIGISFVCAFTTANDQLHWRVAGSVDSPGFNIEAKDPNDIVPYTYVFPIDWPGGEMTMDLLVSINGQGAADCQLPSANLLAEKKV